MRARLRAKWAKVVCFFRHHQSLVQEMWAVTRWLEVDYCPRCGLVHDARVKKP
jgi:hypothetical protein